VTFWLCMARLFIATQCLSATAGSPAASELVIAKDRASDAVIVRAPGAGPHERLAAEDLPNISKYDRAKLPIADTSEAVAAALASRRPLLIVGEQALLAKPDLRASLAAVIKSILIYAPMGSCCGARPIGSISPAM